MTNDIRAYVERNETILPAYCIFLIRSGRVGAFLSKRVDACVNYGDLAYYRPAKPRSHTRYHPSR